MKTPMQQIFYRIEQLRFAKNPIDELMMIRLQMLEKEKEVIEYSYLMGFSDGDCNSRYNDDYYNETFNTKEK